MLTKFVYIELKTIKFTMKNKMAISRKQKLVF
jgi:hypothetical protein